MLLNLWFLVPFLFFYLKENLYQKALDWSGFSEYSINASFLADTFHTNDYRSCPWDFPSWAVRQYASSSWYARNQRKRTVKETASSPIFSAAPVC